jgi:hypothetical protein
MKNMGTLRKFYGNGTSVQRFYDDELEQQRDE